ncbi:uncharacterized protein LOC135204076 [Macrobrachium nipponense]|uniref:uncharacterized protein LOC135204076 n=1 Tax=Macrobrachium nipponense TaxID=159736 RepID=UPI0030C7D62B
MANMRMCGVMVTSGMVLGTIAAAAVCLLGSLVLFSLFASSTCYDDYDWHDYSCSRYTTNLFISGLFLMVIGATVGVGGSMMFFQLKRNSKEALTSGGLGHFTVLTSHPDETMAQEKTPSFYS